MANPSSSDDKPDHQRTVMDEWDELPDSETMITDCDAAIKRNPNDVEAFNWRGVGRAELGDFEGAVDKAQQALILFDETPGDPQQRLAMEQRLAGYLIKKPYRISN